MVFDVGHFSRLQKKYKIVSYKDFSNKLIIPGFIDTHVHYPQTEMIASYGEELLTWLNRYTFPTEKKFNQKKYASKVAKIFLNKMIKNGTTTALVFSTVHKNSVEAFFTEALKKNLRMISGKVLMDRNSPHYLNDNVESSYRDTKDLILKWHKNKRLLYAVSPRFAITSSEKQLEVTGELLSEFSDVYMQTHLAENKSEVEFVKKLFPNSKSYLDVYRKFGLLKSKSIFAHSIYLSSNDFSLLQKSNSSISFCPSSNLFLGSGLFDLEKAESYNVQIGIGTDLGAGTSFSLLQTLGEAYKVTSLHKTFEKNKNRRPLDPLRAFYMATLGGAKSLELDHCLGNFLKDREADFLVLDFENEEFMKFRMQNAKNIFEKLFALMILGGENQIAKVYIMGEEFRPIS